VILVVEDDSDIGDAIRDALEDQGYEVAVAANGRDALDKLRTITADLILLDWMMPVMDGQAFLEALHGDEALSRIPAVILTADLRLADRARDFRVAGFLRKPISLDDLLEAVGKFVKPGKAS
jgi:CheY-like chemotaxis protein